MREEVKKETPVLFEQDTLFALPMRVQEGG